MMVFPGTHGWVWIELIQKHKYLERSTLQIRFQSINDLQEVGEGLALQVFGTLQRTVNAAEGNAKLLRNSPHRSSRGA
jgi:hypothetical protein